MPNPLRMRVSNGDSLGMEFCKHWSRFCFIDEATLYLYLIFYDTQPQLEADTKIRLLLDFSRGAQRVSPVCCVLPLWFRWGGCEKVDPYPHGRDGHAPLFRCKVQFQRDNGISSILFILLIDSICSPFGQTSFVDLRFSPSLSKIRFRVHSSIAWVLDFRFPRRGPSPA